MLTEEKHTELSNMVVMKLPVPPHLTLVWFQTGPEPSPLRLDPIMYFIVAIGM